MSKTILWDFDGVILDSMKVRDWGFEEIFNNYPKYKVDLLLKYHRENGGLSRYVKIRYFFEEILNKYISEETIMQYAIKFSELMKKKLTNDENLIQDSLNFIKQNFMNFNFHIVSGSDQDELRFLCKELNINQYFKSIHGSPTPKNDLVKDILSKNSYKKNDCLLIGDSLNDFDAAHINNIDFLGYGENLKVINKSTVKPLY
jgi:phosphoglycolate phosphatase-like HAD superfamily hydrolase